MPCCGSGRASLGHSARRDDGAGPADGARTVDFVYLGNAALNVIGGATGRRYRFDGAGARLPIDRRDAPGLVAVPNLRRV
jgi:hypothetical protein